MNLPCLTAAALQQAQVYNPLFLMKMLWPVAAGLLISALFPPLPAVSTSNEARCKEAAARGHSC